MEKLIPFDFNGNPTLADWANLLGNVREPDFQACINLASGRQVDLMLSMSHVPNRVARGGFSATSSVQPRSGLAGAGHGGLPQPAGRGARCQCLPAGATQSSPGKSGCPTALRPRACPAAGASRGSQRLAQQPLAAAAGAGAAANCPTCAWCTPVSNAKPLERAAQVASCDVVLSSDPITSELALLAGMPWWPWAAPAADLPNRQGVQGVGSSEALATLQPAEVLQALGLG